MDPSEERLAANETLFRDVNERVQAVRDRTGAFGDPDALEEFLCECGNETCFEKVSLTHREYRAVRAEPRQFLVLRGHQVGGVERVVLENERYGLVVKSAAAAGGVPRRDPLS